MKDIFVIKEDYVNSRFDRWFKRNIFKAPQSYIEKNLRKGNIKVNNKKVKSSHKLQKDDKVIIYNLKYSQSKNFVKDKKYIPTKKDLAYSNKMIVENNENFVILNKPAGIPVQKGTKSNKNIIDMLKPTKEFENLYPYVVHRIDKETTGALIVAKNRKYAQLFTSLFRIRKIHKTYLCISLGEMKSRKGTLTDLLYYYEGKKKITTKAITNYRVIDSNYNYSLLELNPITGRKHQLRKQLLIHGSPVLGDIKYNLSNKLSKKKNSLMLHAYKIYFSINEKKYNFTINPPSNFTDTLREKSLKIS